MRLSVVDLSTVSLEGRGSWKALKRKEFWCSMYALTLLDVLDVHQHRLNCAALTANAFKMEHSVYLTFIFVSVNGRMRQDQDLWPLCGRACQRWQKWHCIDTISTHSCYRCMLLVNRRESIEGNANTCSCLKYSYTSRNSIHKTFRVHRRGVFCGRWNGDRPW